MRSKNHLALAAALALLVAGTGCTRAEPPPAVPLDPARSLTALVASCARAVGTVEVRRAGETGWEAVGAGSVFRAGDEVRTGPASAARIELLAGGGIELEASADVRVDTVPPAAAASASTPRVAVREGVIRGLLPEPAPGPAAPDRGLVISAEGAGDLDLAVQPGGKAALRIARVQGATEIAVLGGKVTLKGTAGERTLTPGQLAVASGAGVAEPVELAPAPRSLEPATDARVHLVPGLTIRLAWRPAPGATAYRVQLSRDPSFARVEVNALVGGTSFVFSPREAGVYAWRVASVDRVRQGEFGAARRLSCEARPPQELLVAPAAGAVIRSSDAPPPVTFTWGSTGEGGPYRIVLATGPDLLAEPVASAVVVGQRAQLAGLAPGEYWWGVYQGGDRRDAREAPRPIFSRPRRLRVVKEAKARIAVPRSIGNWGG